jgi:hypothetical protein
MSVQHITPQHSAVGGTVQDSAAQNNKVHVVPVLEPEYPGCDREPSPAGAAYGEQHRLVRVPLHGYPSAL